MDPNNGSSSIPQPQSSSQDQELGKFIMDNPDSTPQTFPETSPHLPESYGDDRLVVMARDPLCLFAYWEATSERFEALKNEVGDDVWQKGQAVLKVYDVTDVEGDSGRAKYAFDVSISYDARRWYIHLPDRGRQYVVELGFKFPDGRFLVLLKSNTVRLPQGVVSPHTDSQWMIVNVDQWEKMFEVNNNTARGSVEVAQMMAQRWEFLKAVFSGSSSWKKDI